MALLIIVSLLGLIPASIASNKGREFWQWWLYGALLFIIALPHSLFLEKGVRCPHCTRWINRAATVCAHCSRDV